MIQKKMLGSTNIEVSQIGLGTVKFGRNQGVRYPQSFELPDDNTILNLLQCAQELGVNLIDTAPAYGSSEERLGKLLKSHRDQWVLCTKVGEEFINGESFFDFTSVAVEKSIERSLRRLNTDVLDVVLVHSNGEDKKIIEDNEIFETLEKLKNTGKIRSYGMSTKTISGGLLAVNHSDVVMVTYNPLYTEEQIVIERALQKKKGIFIKKGLLSGHLDKIPADDPVRYSMEFIFKNPGVTSVILGTLNPAHLKQVCFSL